MTTATITETCQTVDNDAPDVLAVPQAMTIIPPAGELPSMFPNDVQFALITVHTHMGFRPTGGRDGFPSAAPGLPKEVGPSMVEMVNASGWARNACRWAVRSVNGGLLILRGIDPKTRPLNPNELPVQAEPLAVSSKEEARQIAEERNIPRMEVALVPRMWTFAVENPRFGKVDPLDNLDRGLRSGTLVPNPLRDELEEIHGPEMNRLEELLPIGFEIHNGESFVREGDVYRPATDDEAATGRVEIDIALTFDIRQPIAAQIAARLTELSDQLRQTAAKLVAPGAEEHDADNLDLTPDVE